MKINIGEEEIDGLSKSQYDALNNLENEILFSGKWDVKKPTKRISSYIYKMLREAENSIIISAWRITDKQILNLLKEKAEEGLDIYVYVDVLFDSKMIHKKLRNLSNSHKAFNLYRYNKREVLSNILHTKLIVVDYGDLKNANAFVGSANFTNSGFEKNLEIGIGVKGKTATELGKILHHELPRQKKIEKI